MRVISGTARGRKLETLEGEATRPTTDRVKEAIISAVQFDIENSVVLDLFAGSGQLGIECLSRGASQCIFVDNNRACQEIIKRNLQTTGFLKQSRVVCMQAEDFIKTSSDKFDVVFLDPPYKSGLISEVSDMLVSKMNDNGVIVCETSSSEQMPEKMGDFTTKKPHKFGNIVFWVYRK